MSGVHSHINAWADIWQSGYRIEGRMDVARAVNSSLYAILSSVRTDRPFSLSPGGLTQGYNGHTFWDCETWMYPGMLLLYPDIAQSLLFYRYVTATHSTVHHTLASHTAVSQKLIPTRQGSRPNVPTTVPHRHTRLMPGLLSRCTWK